jgi:uncharacterized protein YcfL
MKKMMMTGALAVVLAALTGCVDTAGTTVRTDHAAGSAQIFEDSARIRDWLDVLSVNYNVVNGLNRVVVTVKSRKHRRIRLAYRISWFDSDGMEIDGDAKTQRDLPIGGLDTVSLTGVAPNAKAVTSKLRVIDLREMD